MLYLRFSVLKTRQSDSTDFFPSGVLPFTTEKHPSRPVRFTANHLKTGCDPYLCKLKIRVAQELCYKGVKDMLSLTFADW